MNTFTRLYDLDTWKKARKFRQDIAEIIKAFPAKERFAFCDQVVRSSRSVTANIAEGYGRYHFKESAHFYRQARGSLYETIDHLICAYDEGYISNEQLKNNVQQAEECGRLLNGLIRHQYLRS